MLMLLIGLLIGVTITAIAAAFIIKHISDNLNPWGH